MIPPPRPPDMVLRDRNREIFLHRWWLVPRNETQNIYLHQFTGDDDDRALHDHPYDSTSLILETGYFEQLADGSAPFRRPGEIVTRLASSPHRVVLSRDAKGKRPSWSLFITGPRLVHPISGVLGDWGFYLPGGWVSQDIINKGQYTGSGDTKQEWA